MPSSTSGRWRASTSSQPEHWKSSTQRGIPYERLKEWERAEPSFKQALELYPPTIRRF